MIVPLDHKTTAQSLGLYWQKKWKLGSQLSGYVWGTMMETGKPCPFAYVNALRMNKLPDSSRKCYVHQMKYSECRCEHTEFQLLTYGRERHNLEQWRRDAILLARKYQRIREAYPDIEVVQYAPCEGTFLGMGGCSGCEFSKYCRMGKRPEFADALLVRGEWKPWEGDDVKIVDWRG